MNTDFNDSIDPTTSDSIDSATAESIDPIVASSRGIERWAKACSQLTIFFIVMALACGIGLYQSGHLELQPPTIGQAEPPPLDRGGKIGPLDSEMDGLRKKHWWWMQWLE